MSFDRAPEINLWNILLDTNDTQYSNLLACLYFLFVACVCRSIVGADGKIRLRWQPVETCKVNTIEWYCIEQRLWESCQCINKWLRGKPSKLGVFACFSSNNLCIMYHKSIIWPILLLTVVQQERKSRWWGGRQHLFSITLLIHGAGVQS